MVFETEGKARVTLCKEISFTEEKDPYKSFEG